MPNAILTSLLSNPFFHTIYDAIPINAKRVVQTGPKTQLGGENVGFIIPAYHVGIDGDVNTDPIIPAASDINIAIMT